jgi:predicted nuclease with TOPRIM domain
MKDQLEQRLKELKVEFESGQKMLAELEVKQANLRESLLRISGAIQVLEEELAKESKQESGDLGLSEVFPEPEQITE